VKTVTPYLKLLRLSDQHVSLGFVIAGAIVANVTASWLWIWGLACVLLSMVAYVLNELQDVDTDTHSWNPIHLQSAQRKKINSSVVVVMVISLLTISAFLAGWVGMLGWWVLLLGLAIAYSLPPLRLKGVAGFDILVQVLTATLIPLLAVLWKANVSLVSATALIVILFLMIWSIFYPYQLADFVADQRAKLGNTHLKLGWQKTLQLMLIVSVLSVILFPILFQNQWWSLPFVIFTIHSGYWYWYWLQVTPQQAMRSMQNYVLKMKPLSHVLLFYLFLLWTLTQFL